MAQIEGAIHCHNNARFEIQVGMSLFRQLVRSYGNNHLRKIHLILLVVTTDYVGALLTFVLLSFLLLNHVFHTKCVANKHHYYYYHHRYYYRVLALLPAYRQYLKIAFK